MERSENIGGKEVDWEEIEISEVNVLAMSEVFDEGYELPPGVPAEGPDLRFRKRSEKEKPVNDSVKSEEDK